MFYERLDGGSSGTVKLRDLSQPAAGGLAAIRHRWAHSPDEMVRNAI